MSSLRLLSKISVPPIEPRGIDESFLVEQFVGRTKTRLAEMQRDLQRMKNWTWLPGSPFQLSHFYGSRGLCQSGTRHAWRQGAGEWEACILLAHQSSIQVVVSIESIPSGSQRRVVTFEAR